MNSRSVGNNIVIIVLIIRSQSAPINTTQHQLKAIQENYENSTSTAEFNEVKTQLSATQKLLNYTKCHSLLDDCTADLQNATQKLIDSDKPTHWDILRQDDYLDHVLTEERLNTLKSEWDYLGKKCSAL